MYSIVGFSCEEFNLAVQSIRSIKIRDGVYYIKKINIPSACKLLLALFTVHMMSNQVLVAFDSLFITRNSSFMKATCVTFLQ